MPELETNDTEIARRDLVALMAAIPEQAQQRMTDNGASMLEAMQLIASYGWIEIVAENDDGSCEFNVTPAGKHVVRASLV